MEVVGYEKRIKHYTSSQKILLVGEGDISFAVSLARAFGCATNMVATSLDSREALVGKYSMALSNVMELKKRGCFVLHEVDVHRMRQHPFLSYIRFDRIVYNFPHAGYLHGQSSSERNQFQIWFHQDLMRGFFTNACEMLTEMGEIHVTHKTTYPFSEWEIVKLAGQVGLYLRQEERFSRWDYPGYENKRGDGLCDQTFPVGKCSTFKFSKLLYRSTPYSYHLDLIWAYGQDSQIHGRQIHHAPLSGDYIFQITGGGEMGSVHAVDLGQHQCTCKRWQLSGIPCVHAICAIRFKNHEASLYCDDYLMSSTYMRAYNPMIYPIAGQDDWEPVDFPIAPPPYKVQPGRPKMQRHKEPGEMKEKKAPPAPKDGKLPRTGIKMSCGICGQQGHNKLGCPITKAAKAAATGEGTSTGTSTANKKQRNPKARRPPLPQGAASLRNQIIRSRKTWKKVKESMERNAGFSVVASSSQTRQQAATQSSQNIVARVSQNKASQPMQPSQGSSEWAGL